MSAIEELRGDLATEAKELPDTIQSARESVNSLSGDLAEILTDALTKANSIATRAQEALGAELLPVQFTGIVHNYRFGMADGKPMHRFDIEVPGTGLWLACQFTSTELDALLVTADPPMDLFDSDAIEGKQVTIKRDPKLGRMVPLTFGTNGKAASLGPVLLQDKKGNDVRAGDEVSLRKTGNRYDRSFVAIVQGFDKKSGTLTVVQKGQKAEKKLKGIKRYVRFESRSTQQPGQISGLSIRALLGVDRNGLNVFEGDVVRLFDEFSDGRIAGVAVRQETSEIILVKRPDRPDQEWQVLRTAIEKIVPVDVNRKDADGRTLYAGDRVILSVGSTKTGGYVISEPPEENGVNILRDDRKVSNSERAPLFSANIGVITLASDDPYARAA